MSIREIKKTKTILIKNNLNGVKAIQFAKKIHPQWTFKESCAMIDLLRWEIENHEATA